MVCAFPALMIAFFPKYEKKMKNKNNQRRFEKKKKKMVLPGGSSSNNNKNKTSLDRPTMIEDKKEEHRNTSLVRFWQTEDIAPLTVSFPSIFFAPTR